MTYFENLDLTTQYGIGVLIAFIFSNLNALASLFTLIIIFKISENNDFNQILFVLTIMQMLSDLVLNFPNKSLWSPTINIFSGLGVALFSLLILIILSYVILTRQYFDLKYYKIRLILSIIIISFIFGFCIYFSLSNGNHDLFLDIIHVYVYLRLFIIVIITVLLFSTINKLKELKLFNNNSSRHPIQLLVKRLSLYPLIQLMSRIPVTMYFKYIL